MRVLVTGGTGKCGHAVVVRLLERGHSVRVLSRRERPRVPEGVETVRGDIARGTGLAEATADVDVIVHCASENKLPIYSRARRTDIEGTSRLLEAAKRSGEPHVVYISIVGIDKIPMGYYRAKLQTEKVIEASGLPYSTLRATQFHPFIFEIVSGLARMPVVFAARGLKFQPVDVGEVADRLVALALGPPLQGRAPDVGGPEVHSFDALAVSVLLALGRRRPVFTPYVPGRTMKAFRAGANLTPDGDKGTIRWEDWLREEVSP